MVTTVRDHIPVKKHVRRARCVGILTLVRVWVGTAIGRSQIVLLPTVVTGAATVMLSITSAVAVPSFRLFAVPDPDACIVSNSTFGCHVVENVLYTGLTLKSADVSSVDQCCLLCRMDMSCAFFTLVPSQPNGTDPYMVQDDTIRTENKSLAEPAPDTGHAAGYHCSLLSAQQGSHPSMGAISGSPSR
eukprot:m.719437 g.719437  ORF g.719437 m.719437 type:complete len:188 (+) comp23001_c0_seq6:3164-3727(+)